MLKSQVFSSAVLSLSFLLLFGVFAFGDYGQVCDPQPLGGHTCPEQCGGGTLTSMCGIGVQCIVDAGSKPGFCKIASSGSCAKLNRCPGKCRVGLSACSCDAVSAGGYGPC